MHDLSNYKRLTNDFAPRNYLMKVSKFLASKRLRIISLASSSFFSNANLVALIIFSNCSCSLLQPVAIGMSEQRSIDTAYDDRWKIMEMKITANMIIILTINSYVEMGFVFPERFKFSASVDPPSATWRILILKTDFHMTLKWVECNVFKIHYSMYDKFSVGAYQGIQTGCCHRLFTLHS
jgi:hypothetical protein